MRIAKYSTCVAALGAALILGGCASGGGGAESDEMASAGPTAGEAAGNVAIQAAATESMKKGGGLGSVGYGLQSQSSNLSRALFGKKKAAPKQQPPAPVASSSTASTTTPPAPAK